MVTCGRCSVRSCLGSVGIPSLEVRLLVGGFEVYESEGLCVVYAELDAGFFL